MSLVIEQETYERVTNAMNARVYTSVRDILRAEGVSEKEIPRIAARVTINFKKQMDEV